MCAGSPLLHLHPVRCFTRRLCCLLLVAETAPHGVRGWFGDAACCASVVGALVLPLAATLAQWRSWRLLGRWLQFSGLLLHGHAHGAGLLAATHARSPRLRRPAVAETVGWPTGRRMMQSGCACEVRSSLAVRALLRAVITVAISKLVAVLASADEADEADWLPPPAASTALGCGSLVLQGVDALLRGAGLPRTEAQRALLARQKQVLPAYLATAPLPRPVPRPVPRPARTLSSPRSRPDLPRGRWRRCSGRGRRRARRRRRRASRRGGRRRSWACCGSRRRAVPLACSLEPSPPP